MPRRKNTKLPENSGDNSQTKLRKTAKKIEEETVLHDIKQEDIDTDHTGSLAVFPKTLLATEKQEILDKVDTESQTGEEALVSDKKVKISSDISPLKTVTRSHVKHFKVIRNTVLGEKEIKRKQEHLTAQKKKVLKKDKNKVESHEGGDTVVIKKEKKTSKSKTVRQERREQAVAEKTNDSKMLKKFVGAHLSISGGLENVIHGAREIGAEAVGLFLKSQRTWKSKPLDEKSVEKFKQAVEEHSFPTSKIVPHGSYLLNCGSPKEDLLTKSRENLIDDLQRCDRLGIPLFNFHPGSTCGEITVEECIERIAESINVAHTHSQQVTVCKAVLNVFTVIENMSCQGHTIGGRFEELHNIINQVKDKSRVGVCLDTCHAFAAGFDISTKAGYEKMMSDFEEIVGLQYLKAIHLNDSKGDVGCHKDRHENIGKGKIGIEGFRRVMNDPRLDDLPMILETPLDIDDSKEIKILYSL